MDAEYSLTVPEICSPRKLQSLLASFEATIDKNAANGGTTSKSFLVNPSAMTKSPTKNKFTRPFVSCEGETTTLETTSLSMDISDSTVSKGNDCSKQAIETQKDMIRAIAPATESENIEQSNDNDKNSEDSDLVIIDYVDDDDDDDDDDASLPNPIDESSVEYNQGDNLDYSIDLDISFSSSNDEDDEDQKKDETPFHQRGDETVAKKEDINQSSFAPTDNSIHLMLSNSATLGEPCASEEHPEEPHHHNTSSSRFRGGKKKNTSCSTFHDSSDNIHQSGDEGGMIADFDEQRKLARARNKPTRAKSKSLDNVGSLADRIKAFSVK